MAPRGGLAKILVWAVALSLLLVFALALVMNDHSSSCSNVESDRSWLDRLGSGTLRHADLDCLDG